MNFAQWKAYSDNNIECNKFASTKLWNVPDRTVVISHLNYCGCRTNPLLACVIMTSLHLTSAQLLTDNVAYSWLRCKPMVRNKFLYLLLAEAVKSRRQWRDGRATFDGRCSRWHCVSRLSTTNGVGPIYRTRRLWWRTVWLVARLRLFVVDNLFPNLSEESILFTGSLLAPAARTRPAHD